MFTSIPAELDLCSFSFQAYCWKINKLLEVYCYNRVSNDLIRSPTTFKSDSLFPHWQGAIQEESENVSHSAVSDSLWPLGLQLTRLLCPWNSPRKNPGVGCQALLPGIFQTQGSNLGLPHCRQILCLLSHQGKMTMDSQTAAKQLSFSPCSCFNIYFKERCFQSLSPIRGFWKHEWNWDRGKLSFPAFSNLRFLRFFFLRANMSSKAKHSFFLIEV